MVATTLVATIALAAGAALSLAATSATCPENPPGCSGVYFDDSNVGAGPSAFNATFTGAFENVALGFDSMPNLTSGDGNVASGHDALRSNTTGSFNVASGNGALRSNTSGGFNVASGRLALLNNTTGGFNVASGNAALRSNTIGGFNVASGNAALFSNTSGSNNVASGSDALSSNSSGSFNVASGNLALNSNTSGGFNVANGNEALRANTIGGFNVASGSDALFRNTTGSNNVASGRDALLNNTTGNSNLALGFGAGANLTSGSNNVYIANRGVATESGKIHIGTKGTHNGAFLAGVNGASIPGPTQPVRVNASGRLGTATASSERLKRDVRPLGRSASRGLLALRPVSYRYKRRSGARHDGLQYGLIAEQVARQLPALVQRGRKGEASGVYYEQLSTLLLAELKRQHRELRRQGRELRRLRAQVSGRR